MKCACRKGVDRNIDGLAYLHRTHNRVGHAHDDLYGIGLGERECGNSGSRKSAQFYRFLNDVAVEWRNERCIAQGDLRFAGQGASRFRLLLAGVILCASRIEVGFGEALRVVQVRCTIQIELCLVLDIRVGKQSTCQWSTR